MSLKGTWGEYAIEVQLSLPERSPELMNKIHSSHIDSQVKL